MELPPGAIKDAEGVGSCCQVFTVAKCQDNTLELGLADPAAEEWVDETATRSLLCSGDFFHVPPGNIYRLENHSTSKTAMIYWTIVKPLSTGEEQSNEEDE